MRLCRASFCSARCSSRKSRIIYKAVPQRYTA
jgi:hypothetical protein